MIIAVTTQFKLRWNRIQIHEFCDTGAVLYQLSYQAICELAMLSVCNIPVDGEEYRWIYVYKL